MENTKDLIFHVQYEKEASKKTHWTSWFLEKIKKHKLVTGSIVIGITLMLADTILVTNFIKILSMIS